MRNQKKLSAGRRARNSPRRREGGGPAVRDPVSERFRKFEGTKRRSITSKEQNRISPDGMNPYFGLLSAKLWVSQKWRILQEKGGYEIILMRTQNSFVVCPQKSHKKENKL